MKAVAENEKLLGIVWGGETHALYASIFLRFNRGKKSVVESVLSKYNFATKAGQKKSDGWDDHQAKNTYNDGDLMIISDAPDSIMIGKMKKKGNENS